MLVLALFSMVLCNGIFYIIEALIIIFMKPSSISRVLPYVSRIIPSNIDSKWLGSQVKGQGHNIKIYPISCGTYFDWIIISCWLEMIQKYSLTYIIDFSSLSSNVTLIIIVISWLPKNWLAVYTRRQGTKLI